MKQGGGKGKGTSFERTVCKRLSLWISQNQRDDLLWRSAISGGRATVGNRKRSSSNLTQLGDICSVSSEGHVLTDEFVIEAKFYRDLGLVPFLFGSGKLTDFWRKVSAEADSAGRYPMLIAKQNRLPEFVLLDKRGFVRFGLVEADAHAILSGGVFLLSLDTLLDTGTVLEQWRPVVGSETRYEISDKGRLRRIGATNQYIGLCQRATFCLGSTARLVLEAFVGPPPTKYGRGVGETLARHLDDCEWNNCLRNVAWGTHSDNAKDAIKNGRRRYGPLSDETKAKISRVHSGRVWSEQALGNQAAGRREAFERKKRN